MKTLHFLTAVVLSVIVLTSCKSNKPQPQAQEHQEFYNKIQIGFDPIEVEQSEFEEMFADENTNTSYNKEEEKSIFGSYSSSNESASSDEEQEQEPRRRAVLNIDGAYTHHVGVSTHYSDDESETDTAANTEKESQDTSKQEVVASNNSYTPYGRGNTGYKTQTATQPYQPSYTNRNTNASNTDTRKSDVRNANDYALNISSKARLDRQSVEPVDSRDYPRLKKYSVVVATLSQQFGIQALKRFFERDGISHFIVKNPNNLYYFVIDSHDSMELANQARIEFLIKHTTYQSQEDIWRRYYVPLTDTFILERR